MQLQSVLDLKAQLRGTASVASVGGGFIKKASTTLPTPQALGVALGIVPGAGSQDFRLAVRTTRTDASVDEYVRVLESVTSGEIDVQHVGEIQVLPPGPPGHTWTGRVRPLRPGFSVAHEKGTAGTIGGFVKKKGLEAVHVLSNNHVLALWDNALHGDSIVQPGPSDGGQADDVIARLQGWIPLTNVNYVDAAIGRMEGGQHAEPIYDGKKLGAPYRPQQAVKAWKVGRTTGMTKGRVTALSLDDLRVAFGSVVAQFDDQIEIEGDAGPFSKGGDSGSLVIDEGNQPFALLFAGSSIRNVSYANALPLVLQLLDADLLH